MAFGDLTTLGAVRAWVNLSADVVYTTRDDALLTALITAASRFIQRYLNRPLLMQDWQETRNGTGGTTLQFGVFPVSAVLQVVVDNIVIPPAPPFPTSNAPQQVVTSIGFGSGWGVGPGTGAGYVFTPTQIALSGYWFSRGIQNVRLVYTAGHATVPPDVEHVCIELVDEAYKRRTRIGEVSKHLGDGSTVAFSQRDMHPALCAMLAPYRNVAPIAASLMQAPTQTDPAMLVAAA